MKHVNEVMPIPRAAKLLGYAGVIPFAAMALNQLVGGPLPVQIAQEVFLYYSAAILSFLGGIRWGAATRREDGLGRELIISVLPSLWAVASLMIGDAVYTAWSLLAGFVVMGFADVFRPAPGLALWMRRLRLQLTVAVVICHLVMAVLLHF